MLHLYFYYYKEAPIRRNCKA